MTKSQQEWMTVEAEVRVPAATVQLVQLYVSEPSDMRMMDREAYWLDMCLTPRPNNARLCYPDHWSRHRFERVGQVYFLPPGESVQFRNDGGRDLASIFCHINPDVMRDWLGSDLRWKGRQFEASLDITDTNVRALLLRLAQELRRPGFASELLVELITGQLAIELGRHFSTLKEISSTHELARWRLRLLDELIHNAQTVPTLAELANHCNLSVRQLTRAFRASRGCSIGEYIANQRVERAKYLLNGDQSIKAIAYALGFPSPSGFCTAFRQATQMTPSEFRASITKHN